MISYHFSHLSASVLLAAMLLGCTVGPDYQKPETQLPADWVSDADQAKEAAIQQDWWQNFSDPILNQLIAKAATGNFDLKMAEARIAEARAARSTADATLLPSGDLKGSATREANQFAFPGNLPGLTKPFDIFQTGFDASWELDLFGGHRREIESANAQLQASEASRADIMVSLLAEVARTYTDIRQAQAQLATTQNMIASENKTVSLVREQTSAGIVAGIDLIQAEAQLQQAQTQLPYYRNMVAQAEYSMDLLLGEQPGASKVLVDQPQPILVSNSKLILAAPAAVIANRPDINVAERKLAAATAQQGVAVAKFFPDISLQGFVGLLNTNAGNLLTTAGESWLMGGSVIWPILSYGTLSANLDTANAQQQEAMVTYQKSMISALSDVEKSVTAYTEQEKFRQAQALTVEENRHARDVAQQRYKEGLTSFLEVLDAERTLFTSESQLVDANAKTTDDLIAVYKSLGGGWNAQGSSGHPDATVTPESPAETK